MIEIPWRNLPEETLFRLLEEIVTRDGTDYGEQEKSVETRLKQAQSSLQQGRAVLVWDQDSETASLVNPELITD